ncbi:hypothetical protein [Sulfitobacter sp. 20_GPM-1509m]|uniref:hypothetical protein n=1 Tax=Sulfitobacter sp. 20_GPM-1509m TaxID=1380367 RepID=UPI0012DC3324|nr:hypothetical protein [Sulfitobacter sp. 20_GPM-1509m]
MTTLRGKMASIGRLAKQLEFFEKIVASARFNPHAMGAELHRNTRAIKNWANGGFGEMPQAAVRIAPGRRPRDQSREST